MRGILYFIFFLLTAPVRLFGRSRAFRWLIAAVVTLGIFFTATLWVLDRYFPTTSAAKKAVANLPKLPPLPPMTRSSYVIAPVAISLSAIQSTLEASAPRELIGKANNPISGLLSKGDIGITVGRGNIALNGKPNELTAITQLNGTVKITGQLATQAGNLTGNLSGTIGSLLGGGALGNDVGKVVGGLTGRVLDQNIALRSQATVRARPSIAANWRLQPNLSAQVDVGNSNVQVAGIRINVASEAKPLIEQQVNEQVGKLEARIRNDPFLENSAREQWKKMCQSMALGGGDTGLPELWLEMRPVRAAAAQPQVDARNLTLVIGVQAETRITSKETKPNCPFPSTLELVPPMQNGKLQIGLPIDMPFTTLSKLLNDSLKGHRYPEGKDAPVEIEVRKASLAAAGDRLLIALDIKAIERKSWFGFGATANINIWGKPVLDPKTQVLRLTDITLDVDSQSAYGLLGTAARAALPYLQDGLAEKAVVDLTPFLDDAKKKIAEKLKEFRKARQGVDVDATINDLRLSGIAFDSTTLRVIAEANGTTKVAVTSLPRL